MLLQKQIRFKLMEMCMLFWNRKTQHLKDCFLINLHINVKFITNIFFGKRHAISSIYVEKRISKQSKNNSEKWK